LKEIRENSSERDADDTASRLARAWALPSIVPVGVWYLHDVRALLFVVWWSEWWWGLLEELEFQRE